MPLSFLSSLARKQKVWCLHFFQVSYNFSQNSMIFQNIQWLFKVFQDNCEPRKNMGNSFNTHFKSRINLSQLHIVYVHIDFPSFNPVEQEYSSWKWLWRCEKFTTLFCIQLSCPLTCIVNCLSENVLVVTSEAIFKRVKIYNGNHHKLMWILGIFPTGLPSLHNNKWHTINKTQEISIAEWKSSNLAVFSGLSHMTSTLYPQSAWGGGRGGKADWG